MKQQAMSNPNNAKARRQAKRALNQRLNRVPSFITMAKGCDITDLEARVKSGQTIFLGEVQKVAFSGDVFIRFGNETFASKHHGLIRAGTKDCGKLAKKQKCTVRVEQILTGRSKPLIKLSVVSIVAKPTLMAVKAKPAQAKPNLVPSTAQLSVASAWSVLGSDADSNSDVDSASDSDEFISTPRQTAKQQENRDIYKDYCPCA